MLAKDNKVLEYYNKNDKINQKHGTLMSNWWEEQILKEETGTGRTAYNRHVTKNRKELFSVPPSELNLQNNYDTLDTTYNRCLGRQQYNEYSLSSQTIGNQVLTHKPTPLTGPRQQFIDTKVFKMASDHVLQQDINYQMSNNNLKNNTLYQQDFTKHDLTINKIGTRVMKTQDMKDIQV